MKIKIAELLDGISNFLSKRKGFLPILGIILIILNFVLSLFLSTWISQTNLFLHMGLIFAILGFMLAWVL